MKIRTSYWAKPIPTSEFDWSAVTEDYDGASKDPIGYGATEQEAIDDLLEQLSALSEAYEKGHADGWVKGWDYSKAYFSVPKK